MKTLIICLLGLGSLTAHGGEVVTYKDSMEGFVPNQVIWKPTSNGLGRYVLPTERFTKKQTYEKVVIFRDIPYIEDKKIFVLVPPTASRSFKSVQNLKNFFIKYASSCPGDRRQVSSMPLKDNRVDLYSLNMTSEKVIHNKVVDHILKSFRPFIFAAQFDDENRNFSKDKWLELLKQIPRTQACLLMPAKLSHLSKKYLKELNAILSEQNHSCQLVQVETVESLYANSGKQVPSGDPWFQELKYQLCEIDPTTYTQTQNRSTAGLK